ncbi:MAG: UDP-N-acetylmuramoyl-tripeptide--D-alanyl-D-alanine ligase [Chitinivibrionales bacterium]|nr:UDP-N-acetylmuramoyl-tripeptide--D-alanyl-D-alanine ligase [Chitinivibrionales bacterium]
MENRLNTGESDLGPLSSLTLGDLVEWGGCRGFLSAALLQTHFRGLNMDSRLIQDRDVFIALKTDQADGHAYVPNAFKAGAIAAIVEADAVGSLDSSYHDRLIITAEPLLAVQRMASQYRKKMGIPIIAVTGSNGKTTTRMFISAVLSAAMKVGSTRGNWNNHIGVPLSILHFSGAERVGVLEMGANHSGEIHVLSEIATPDIACISNIGYAHVGNFGNLRKTTAAKFEIVDGLNQRGGFMVLNGDDLRLVKHAKTVPFQVQFFGTSKRCHFRAENIEVTAAGQTFFTVSGKRFTLNAAGRHFVYSGLTALACGEHFGLSQDQIGEALAAVEPDSMRGRIVDKNGDIRFIVDCYNANPTSMASSIRLLADVAGARRKCAVVADMLELGPYSKRLHSVVGRQLGHAGVELIIAVGQYSRQIADAARQAGVKAENIVVVAKTEEALAPLKSMVRPGDIVLIKGSRGMKLEYVFNNY